MSKEAVILEILYFGMIHLAFFALPLLIELTLYFILLHSLKVLRKEFIYLKSRIRGLGLLIS